MFKKKKAIEEQIKEDLDRIKTIQINEYLSHNTFDTGEKYSWVKCKNCYTSTNFDYHMEEENVKYFSCRKCGVNLASGKYEDDYIVIWVNEIEELKRLVNKAIKKGYKPIGKITEGSYTWLYQAMIKKELK